LRAFLRKHGINYDRKILLILKEKKKEVSLRLPVHFAKGFALILERWIYAGC
jgi:Holliday junction resolvase RusA-like endonuclease